MVFSLKKFKQRMKFFLQLLILTVLFYYSLNLITRWIEPVNKYQIPAGYSQKVFQHEVLVEQQLSIKDRLAMYYWMGE